MQKVTVISLAHQKYLNLFIGHGHALDSPQAPYRLIVNVLSYYFAMQ
jgi:hypothetical protein